MPIAFSAIDMFFCLSELFSFFCFGEFCVFRPLFYDA